MSFDEFVQKGMVGDTNWQYDVHLQEWFRLFSRDQILLLSHDELVRDPQQVQNRIQSFLGMRIRGNIPISNKVEKKHKEAQRMSLEAKLKLTSMMEQNIRRFYEIIDANPGPPMEQRPFPNFHSFPDASRNATR